METGNVLGNALEAATAAAGVVELKEFLISVGRQQAFGLMANRSAAAQAQILAGIKRGKQYKELGLTWEEFCDQHAGMSRNTVEALIKRLEEFGETYFRLAEVVRVSPDAYRQLESSIEDGVILYGGDRVEITRTNADKIREIVEAGRAELRRSRQAEADAKQRAKELTLARDDERARADRLDKAEKKRLADEASFTAGRSAVSVRLLKAHSQIAKALVEIQGAAGSPEMTESDHRELRGLRDWVIDQVAAASGMPLDPFIDELLEPVDISIGRAAADTEGML